MIKKFFKHVQISAAIGFFITTACLWLFGAYEATGFVVLLNYTAWLGASVLYGIISVIYDSSMPFPINLAIHFLGCAAITLVATWTTGFFNEMVFGDWLTRVFPLFVIIYAIISAVVFLTERKRAKQINEKLKK